MWLLYKVWAGDSNSQNSQPVFGDCVYTQKDLIMKMCPGPEINISSCQSNFINLPSFPPPPKRFLLKMYFRQKLNCLNLGLYIPTDPTSLSVCPSSCFVYGDDVCLRIYTCMEVRWQLFYSSVGSWGQIQVIRLVSQIPVATEHSCWPLLNLFPFCSHTYLAKYPIADRLICHFYFCVGEWKRPQHTVQANHQLISMQSYLQLKLTNINLKEVSDTEDKAVATTGKLSWVKRFRGYCPNRRAKQNILLCMRKDTTTDSIGHGGFYYFPLGNDKRQCQK